jgi:hypothetical protein
MRPQTHNLRKEESSAPKSMRGADFTTLLMKNFFAAPTTIRRFFVRAMLLMPVAFTAWYLLVPALHWPIRWFLSGMAALGMPEFLTQVTQTLSGFELITSLTPGVVAGQPFRPDAILTTDIDARIYTWGTALMATLTLAAWDKFRWKYLWYGFLILLPFQMAAVFAVGMKQMVLASPAVMAQVDWAQWQFEAVAYLYQFSTLMMPPVTAVVVWLVLHRNFVAKFVGADVIDLIRATEKRAKRA